MWTVASARAFTITDASTADGQAAANGTESIVADEIGTDILRIRYATGVGGSPIAPLTAAEAAIALAEVLTPAASVWSHANLNLSPYRVRGGFFAAHTFTVTTQMITDTARNPARISFPFIVTGYALGLHRVSSGGLPIPAAQLAAGSDTITIDNGDILVTLGGGGGADFINGNQVSIFVWGEARA